MKVSVLISNQPFQSSMENKLANRLAEEVIRHGHKAQVVAIPFVWKTPEQVVDNMLAVRLTCIPNTDLVIALNFPAFYIEHFNKKVWMVNQFRQAYENTGENYAAFTKNDEHKRIKQSIARADKNYLGRARGIYTVSHSISEKLYETVGLTSDVLYPPLEISEKPAKNEYSDYFYCPDEIRKEGRQLLAVEAMRYVKSHVRLVLAGAGCFKPIETMVQHKIELYGLQEKVICAKHILSKQEKKNLANSSLAGLLLNEADEYGREALEMMDAGKALLTCTDSGCATRLVLNGESGESVEPEPYKIAEMMDKMYENRQRTVDMGKNAAVLFSKLGVTWENVVSLLTK